LILIINYWYLIKLIFKEFIIFQILKLQSFITCYFIISIFNFINNLLFFIVQKYLLKLSLLNYKERVKYFTINKGFLSDLF